MSSKAAKIRLKKNKTINKIWHPESTLVFKSAKEKKVIGRFLDEKFIPLDEEALTLCEEWHFKFDANLVEEEEVENEFDDEKDVAEEEVRSIAPSDASENVTPSPSPSPSLNKEFMDVARLTETFTAKVDAIVTGLQEKIENLEKELGKIQESERKLQAKFNQLKALFS